DLEYVRWPVAEDLRPLPGKIEISVRVASCAILRPDEEDGRARAVFPTHHGIPDQRAECEVGITEREWLRWTGVVGIDGVRRSTRRGGGRAGDRPDILPIDELARGPRRRELAER